MKHEMKKQPSNIHHVLRFRPIFSLLQQLAHNHVAHNTALILTCLRRLEIADKTHMNGE